ncbi:hypothetical protein BOTBODRAFT_251567 [Botryobasidium botryosum FD-172 SS1]|uniref:F-box domain-containing protein n=1 Tax=Botryobasidium botryosum (strain FD-172 SS1) TaxID=930990 RepID=A0A067MYB1_BOTB1|nr:hypothetical protein BOTBODRAFT_251567 [Botryobasidium botryosum FD-172 SS1]
MKAIALPADVVLNIYRLKYYDGDADLLNLSYVCQIWRDALHRFPDFWAKVDLHLGKRGPDQKAAYWVKRAGQKPLVIHVRCGGPQPVMSARRLALIIVRIGLVLRGCMDRWDSFTIEAGPQEIEHLLPICTGYAPRLRVLSLSDWTGSDVQRVLVPILPSAEPASGSSQLSVIVHNYIPRFTMFGLGITQLSVDLDWPDEDSAFSLNDLFSIFQSCPNLIDFHLSAPGSDDMGPPSLSGVVFLPRLTTLSLSWVRNVGDVFSFLRLPLLESIALHEAEWSDAARVGLWSVFESSPLLSSVVVQQDDDYHYEREPVPFHPNPLTLSNMSAFHMEGSQAFLQPLLGFLTLPRVEKLGLAGAPISSIHRLLSSSNGLRDLTLRSLRRVPAQPDSAPTPAQAPVILPSLTSLEITGFPAFVDHIHAPRLKTLKLENHYNAVRIVDSGIFLRAAIEQSAFVLTTLCLNGLYVGDKDIQWCLERLPALEELSISYCAISDAILSALALPPQALPEKNTSWLLPCLKRFAFEKNDHITTSGALKFLASRTLNPVPNITGNFGFTLHLSREDAAAVLSYGSFLSSHHCMLYYLSLEGTSDDELLI